MKTAIGAIIGALAASALLLAWHGRSTSSQSPTAHLFPTAYTDAAYRSGVWLGGPVLVNCAPNERVVVHPAVVNGEQVSQVECVADPNAARYAQAYGAPYAPMAYPAPRRVAYQTPERTTSQPRRSWMKSAAIIGGATTIWEATKH